MKTLVLFIISLLSFLYFNCSDDNSSSNPQQGYKVSGQVLSEGMPVDDAHVIINNFLNLQTMTDSTGRFNIYAVPKGDYTLKISKESENGSFIERNVNISVEADLVLNALILPKPVFLYEIENVTANSADIKWSETDASDFREYKLYKHTTAGLDETTGTLVYVTTIRNDTSFTVSNLDPLTEYFFRVYVMNDYGRLGGSNIVSTETPNLEIIINGSFESINQETGYPFNWHAPYLYYIVDSVITQDGKYSIRVENCPGVDIIYQIVNTDLLTPNSHYKLTYWIKHDQLAEVDEFAVFINNAEFTWHVIANLVAGPKLASDWTFYEYDFTAPDIPTANYSFGFYFYIENNKKAWLDNISLKKVL